MAMDSKQDFLRNVERLLSESVTVSDMNVIMKTMANVLESYDMRLIEQWPDEKDDCPITEITVPAICRYCGKQIF